MSKVRERRKSKRVGKRLSVRWGEAEFENGGFTVDVSTSGMFVVSRVLPELGKRVHLQVQVTPTQLLHFEGRVQRHKQAPRALQSVAATGFGVSFVPVEELVAEIIPPPRGAPLEVLCETAEHARQLRDGLLRQGGLFVSSQSTFQRDEPLTVALKFPFAKTEFVVEGKVLQLMPGFGVALQVERAAEVAALLEGVAS